MSQKCALCHLDALPQVEGKMPMCFNCSEKAKQFNQLPYPGYQPSFTQQSYQAANNVGYSQIVVPFQANTSNSQVSPIARAVPFEVGRVTLNGLTILVGQGDLTLDSSDCIVNAANQYLTNGSGLARAIIDYAGQSVDAECKAWIQKFGKLDTGKCIITEAGKLPCRKIIHAVGPQWSGGNQNEPMLLVQAMQNILQAVSSIGMYSVAIPAISTGIFQFPLDLCAQILVSVAAVHKVEFPNSSIRQINFINHDEKSVAAFAAELAKVFGRDYVPYRPNLNQFSPQQPQSQLQLPMLQQQQSQLQQPMLQQQQSQLQQPMLQQQSQLQQPMLQQQQSQLQQPMLQQQSQLQQPMSQQPQLQLQMQQLQLQPPVPSNFQQSPTQQQLRTPNQFPEMQYAQQLPRQNPNNPAYPGQSPILEQPQILQSPRSQFYSPQQQQQQPSPQFQPQNQQLWPQSNVSNSIPTQMQSPPYPQPSPQNQVINVFPNNPVHATDPPSPLPRSYPSSSFPSSTQMNCFQPPTPGLQNNQINATQPQTDPSAIPMEPLVPEPVSFQKPVSPPIVPILATPSIQLVQPKPHPIKTAITLNHLEETVASISPRSAALNLDNNKTE